MIGYVYIMINPAFPNLIKIGRTTKLSDARASELYTTGTPGKFIVIYDELVDNCIEIEELMHSYFSNARYSDGREFFEIEPKEAIRILQKYSENRIVYLNNESLAMDEKNSELSEYQHCLYRVYIGVENNRNLYRFGLLSFEISFYENNQLKIKNELVENVKNYYKEIGMFNYYAKKFEIQEFLELASYSIHIKNNLIKILKSDINENLQEDSYKYWDKIYDEQTLSGPINYYETDLMADALLGSMMRKMEEFIDNYHQNINENIKNNKNKMVINSYKDFI